MIPPAPAPVLTRWFAPFASAFTAPTLRGVLVLIAGAILAPGRRTVTSALSIMGLREIATFTTFHRVLNRNRWSPRDLARRLLHQLIDDLRARGTGGDGHRRDHRAPLGRPDQGPRHLSRSGPLHPWPFRQGLGPALDQPHAPGADPLGRSRVGAAVPDRPGALGTLCPRERAAAQAVDRLGAPDAAPGRPLAARATDHRRGRYELCGHRAA